MMVSQDVATSYDQWAQLCTVKCGRVVWCIVVFGRKNKTHIQEPKHKYANVINFWSRMLSINAVRCNLNTSLPAIQIYFNGSTLLYSGPVIHIPVFFYAICCSLCLFVQLL